MSEHHDQNENLPDSSEAEIDGNSNNQYSPVRGAGYNSGDSDDGDSDDGDSDDGDSDEFDGDEFDDDDGSGGDGINNLDLGEDDEIVDGNDTSCKPYIVTEPIIDAEEEKDFRKATAQLLADVPGVESEILRAYMGLSAQKNSGEPWDEAISLAELSQLCNAVISRRSQIEGSRTRKPVPASRFKGDRCFYDCWIVDKLFSASGRTPKDSPATLARVTAEVLNYLVQPGPQLNDSWVNGSTESEKIVLSLGEEKELVCRKRCWPRQTNLNSPK